MNAIALRKFGFLSRVRLTLQVAMREAEAGERTSEHIAFAPISGSSSSFLDSDPNA
jgi:hypothetical protein